MNEVKTPKKPLIFYYGIAMVVLLLLNMLVMPLITQHQVEEVDYGTFIKMTENKEIGQVEIEDNQILFTNKDKSKIYKTGLLNDDGLVQRLYDSGAEFSGEIVEQMSPLMSFIVSWVLPVVLFVVLGQLLSRQQFDVMTVVGNCATMATLNEAKVQQAEVLIAATSADEINLLCCLTARKMNPTLHTIARVRSPEYREQLYMMRGEVGLSLIINPEREAAKEIFRLLQLPGFLKRETFAKGRVEIVELRVLERSPLENVILNHLPHVLGCKVLVCAVIRDGHALIPSGDTLLRRGDHIYVTAPVTVLSYLMKRLGITQKKIRHAMLIGGGRVSYYLAQMLIGADVRVKIIENNPQRSEQLAQMLPEAAIICADGANQEILEAEGLNETDALVTLTGIDEQNIITSMVGNAKGVPHIVTKVNRIMTTGMVETLPIGSVVSPKELCSANIVQYVRAMQHQTGAAVTLHRIADGRAEALEFIVNKQSKYIGEPLKNLRLRLKKNILISCITHHGNTVIPDGESYYQLGDTVIVVTTREQPVLQFNDIFV